ncbi:Radial spoke head protein 4 A [Sparganum proliferum]
MDMLDFDENGFPIEGPPKPLWKPPPTVPVEAPGQGANKHAYFVLSEFGSDWELLPAVEPEQIKCARKIRLFFTGDLDATIISYPPFPGKERHLLRAQIARITAATLISPMNFYRFDEEEEESDDEEVHHEHFVENEEYEPLTVAELADPSVTNWVHHAPYLLPQGRTKWINVIQKDESDSEDSEASSKTEEIDLPEPETGPPLLTPIAEDQDPSGIPPWSAKLTSSRLPQFAMAVLSSNLWPGAYAIGFEQNFLNFYIGWGQKYIISNFEPALHPDVMEEFPSGPETTEMEDPTADEEEAWKAAHAELGGGSKEDSGSNSDEGNEDADDWADEDA